MMVEFVKSDVLFVVLFIVLHRSVVADIAASVVVKTVYGAIQGVELNGRRVFRGIPYAAPPLGDLRWRLPRHHPGWEGVLDASNFGPACMSARCWKTDNASQLSEDCLLLNVLAPSTPGKFPVLVYFHAGEFRCGSANDIETNWPSFAADIVYVTLDFRSGPLGFLAGTELRKRHPKGGAGNYGISDQRFALEWVLENIEAFGGDPHSITIAGESSGGTSVALHIALGSASPPSGLNMAPSLGASFHRRAVAPALFTRAILESPGLTQLKAWNDAAENFEWLLTMLVARKSSRCTRGVGYRRFKDTDAGGITLRLDDTPLEDAIVWCDSNSGCVGFSRDVDHPNRTRFLTASIHPVHADGASVFMKSGPDEEQDRLQCLLSADAFLLLEVTEFVPRDDTFFTDAWAPVIDGVDLTEIQAERIKAGHIDSEVDILVGTNLDEGTQFMALTPYLNCTAGSAELAMWMEQFVGKELAKKVIPLYSNDMLRRPLPFCKQDGTQALIVGELATSYMGAMRAAGDVAILCPARTLAQTVANGKRRAFVYQFEITPTFSLNDNSLQTDGAFHGAEVPFAYGFADELVTESEQFISKLMTCHWRSFILHGDPGVEKCGFEGWSAYDGIGGVVLVIGNGSVATMREPESFVARCEAFAASSLSSTTPDVTPFII